MKSKITYKIWKTEKYSNYLLQRMNLNILKYCIVLFFEITNTPCLGSLYLFTYIFLLNLYKWKALKQSKCVIAKSWNFILSNLVTYTYNSTAYGYQIESLLIFVLMVIQHKIKKKKKVALF